MKTLKLTLKKQWFDMIASGVKKEEYREIKPYFISRLTNVGSGWRPEARQEVEFYLKYGDETTQNIKPTISQMQKRGINFENYDAVEFTNGYGKHRPQITLECLGIEIGQGNCKWGAPLEDVFIIKLGNRINKTEKK